MRIVISCALIVALAGCADMRPGFLDGNKPDAAPSGSSDTMRPPPRPDGDGVEPTPIFDPGAPTIEDGGDDVIPVSVTPPTSDGGALGTTIASLGDPAAEGFWMKTPLVSAVTQGRVVYPDTGRSVRLELIPSGGPAGGGSQLSLAAMRLLEAPLADLVEVTVYSN